MDHFETSKSILLPGTSLEDVVVQSPNDKRKYRVIVLENGLRALLISDIDADPECSTSTESEKPHQPHTSKTTGKKEEPEVDSVSDEESDGTDDDSDISEMEQDAASPSSPSSQSAKKRGDDDDSEKLAAAALCIGVGSFCDPPDVPGLAHFLEHMVFMGSKKYPDENAFDSYVKKHGGNDNAFTDCERTVFYFDVERKHFRGALDIFAQFFISPLMKQNSVDREIKAVDSEFDMSKTSDSARKQQLLSSLAKSGAPMAKFMWGNVDSLKDTPASKGIDLYDNLQIFHERYYSAHFMTLCVQAKESLDTLQSWVTEIFSPVPNNNSTHPTFGHITGTFDTAAFTKLYQVVPVKNVHQVEITWHLPCLKHLYRYKPLHYIGWLSGHEGIGSILSYLRKKLWALSIASGNGESGWEHNSTGSLFVVNATLTDEGLAHVNEVMMVIFEYFAMLRNCGASRPIYNQIKEIEDNEFRWKEQVDPSDYVEHLSEAMQMYEPVDYLRGDNVLYDCNSQCEFAIEEVLGKLLANNCNVMIISRNFDSSSAKVKEEYWYKTKYVLKDIPSSIKNCKNLKPRPELHIPCANDYIATDFSLKQRNDLYTKEPKLVLSTDRSRLWYKQDKKFKVPRSYIYFDIMSPVISASAKSQALFDLFIDALSHNLQEVAYNAHVAQLEYEFRVTTNGVVIKLNGFSHKLLKLFETIMDHIENFDLSEGLFSTLNEQLKKKYYNTFIKPDKLARDIRLMILEDRSWTKVHRRAFLLELRRSDLLSFVSEFKRMNFIEGYIHGNYTLNEAMSIEACIRNKLRSDILPLSMLPVERVASLPLADCTVRVKSFHEGDANSCVVNYYQVGPVNIRGFVTNELLNLMMDEPCFDILRTREQLGYSVYAAAKNTDGIVGLCVGVSSQASKFSVQAVNEKIEQFLVEFRDRLDSCTLEEFDNQRKSLIAIKQCDDSHLGEEADRLWAEIRDKTYLFDRLDKEIDELEKLKLDDVRLWFLNALDTNEANLRKKLSVQIVGFGENETDSPVISEAFSTLSQSNAVDLSLCQEMQPMECKLTSAPSSNSSSDTAVTAPLVAAETAPLGAADTATVFEFQHLEIDLPSAGDRKCTVINDMSKFKCGLALYPVSKVL